MARITNVELIARIEKLEAELAALRVAPIATVVASQLTISDAQLKFWRPKAIARLQREQPDARSWKAEVVNSLAQRMCVEARAARATAA